ncbi:MAG: hypothetical protein HYY01_11770 [Chloroflexi bacterium]|nr:hypothetical protein [Chloroflexota bacterium]
MAQQHNPETRTLAEIKAGLKEQMEGFCAGNPYCLNPKAAVVDYILEGLAQNVLEHGYAYCTCKVPTGVPEDDKDLVCPCASMSQQVAEYGHCDCALFVNL